MQVDSQQLLQGVHDARPQDVQTALIFVFIICSSFYTISFWLIKLYEKLYRQKNAEVCQSQKRQITSVRRRTQGQQYCQYRLEVKQSFLGQKLEINKGKDLCQVDQSSSSSLLNFCERAEDKVANSQIKILLIFEDPSFQSNTEPERHDSPLHKKQPLL